MNQEDRKLVGEQVRARLKRAVMQWLTVNHATILTAANCNGQGQGWPVIDSETVLQNNTCLETNFLASA